MKINIKVFIPSVFLLVSCDGFQAIDGMIVDSESKKPISNVLIKEINKFDALGFSDEQGYFEFHEIKGFTFGDKEMTIVFLKEIFNMKWKVSFKANTKIGKLTNI